MKLCLGVLMIGLAAWLVSLGCAGAIDCLSALEELRHRHHQNLYLEQHMTIEKDPPDADDHAEQDIRLLLH